MATIGPASSSEKIIKRLLIEGVNVFRINFSHGNHQDHSQALSTIRAASDSLQLYPAILADLQGPKIRTSKTEGDRKVTLLAGSTVILTPQDVLSDERIIGIDYALLAKEVSVGQKVMINDGLVELVVDKVDQSDNRVICTVVNGGEYSSHKGVNLPDVALSIPSLTEKDRTDLDFILKNDFQYIALSFVRSDRDIITLREAIGKRRPEIKIIAKIEKPQATENIDRILEVSEGIMVARGDLGVEMSPELVPIAQKQLINRANDKGRMVIVATQMLESMIYNALPTRAEAADVANAILDETDALMLSGETAIGKYPVESVKMMSRIARTAEKSSYAPDEFVAFSNTDSYPPHALAESAVCAAKNLGGIPVCIFTLSGDTAFFTAKLRNQSPVFVFSPDINVVKMVALAWNSEAFLMSLSDGDQVKMVHTAEEILVKRGLVKNGHTIAVLAGTTPVRGATNFLRIKKVGEP